MAVVATRFDTRGRFPIRPIRSVAVSERPLWLSDVPAELPQRGKSDTADAVAAALAALNGEASGTPKILVSSAEEFVLLTYCP